MASRTYAPISSLARWSSFAISTVEFSLSCTQAQQGVAPLELHLNESSPYDTSLVFDGSGYIQVQFQTDAESGQYFTTAQFGDLVSATFTGEDSGDTLNFSGASFLATSGANYIYTDPSAYGPGTGTVASGYTRDAWCSFSNSGSVTTMAFYLNGETGSLFQLNESVTVNLTPLGG